MSGHCLGHQLWLTQCGYYSAYEFFFLQLSKGSNHILLELIMFVLFFLVDFSTFYFLVIAVRVRACAYKDAYAYMCMHVLPFCKL